MKQYEQISDVVSAYLTPNQHGFDDWVLVKATYLKEHGTLLVTLANPILYEYRQVSVAHSSENERNELISGYRTHYLSQLEKRFGFFLPGKGSGDVEYESFDLFRQYWVDSDETSYLPFNIPLLFDFPSDLEYAEAVADETISLNYQRLMVIVAQPRKRRIKTLFIQNVSESDFSDIQQLMTAKLESEVESLF